MKRHLLILSLFILTLISQESFAQRFWISATPSNWNNTANWSASSGGAGGASVPGVSDLVTFNALGIGNCTLDIAANVAGITVNGYTGIININGFNLTTTGANTFATGTINNGGGGAALTLNTIATSTFSGTTFGANVNGSTGRIFLNGSTFNGIVSITKTANNTDLSTGGNTFQGAVTLTNGSTSQFRLAGTNPDIFNGSLALVSGNTGPLEIAYTSAATQFNQNISITYNSTGAITFGANGGTSTLAAARTISVVGFGGAGCGNLSLARLTQTGATAQTINLSGNNTATLTLGPASSFAGSVTTTTPSIILNSSSFQALTITKTGTQNDNSRGGNIFNGIMTVNNQGGDFLMGTNAADAGDTWNTNAIFNNTGGNRLRVAEDNAGNLFNGNATFTNTSATDVASRIQVGRFASASTTFNGTTTFNNSGNASDVHISYDAGSLTTFNGPVVFNSDASNGAEFWVGQNGDVAFNGSITINSSTDGVLFGNGVGTVTMSVGNTIALGGSGFTGGRLLLRNFTQAGTTAMTLPLTGASTFQIGPNSAIGGNANFSAPRILTNGVTYGGTATLEKTGGLDDASIGNNIFNGVTTITNSGSGYLLMGNGNPDQFNANTTFNNNGSYRIYFGHNHAGQTTSFAADLTLNSNKTGGADGWSYLIAESTNTNISVAGNLTINCAGALQSNHRILQGTGSALTVGGDVAVNLTNTHASTAIQMGVIGTTTYNGNISVVNSGGANGVSFNVNASGSSTMVATKAISIGAGGFSSGTLSIPRFTQLGTAPTTLNLTGTSTILRVGPLTTFGGNADLRSAQLYLDGIDVGGTAYLEKTDAGNSTGLGNNNFTGTTTIVNSGSGQLRTNGNNTFNGATTITNNGTADILLELASGSTYNGDVTFTNTNSSSVRVAYQGTTFFNGNILVNSISGTGILFSEIVAGSSTLAATKGISVGVSGFSTGTLSIPRFTQLGSAPTTLNLTGTSTILRVGPLTTFGGNTDLRAAQLYLDGIDVGGTAYLEKKDAGNNTGLGNNNFSGTTTLVNNGTGQLRTNGNNTFNGTTTITNNGTADILLELASGSTYNGDVTFTNTNSSYVRVAYLGATSFNGNLSVNSTAGVGVYFSENIGGTSTLAATKTISVGGSGFSNGTLSLLRFSQIGATPQTLTLTGNSSLIVGPTSAFDGNVNFSSPRVYLNGCTYGGTVTVEKNGGGDDASAGGNIFTGLTTMTNTGSGYLLLGNINRDQFLSSTTFNNTGSYRIYFAHNHGGQTTSFASDVTLNSNKTGGADPWSFLVGEGNNIGLSIGGTLTINCAGAIQSNHRFLNGNGSTAAFGVTAINLTNTHVSTLITMGENGTSTYAGNITVLNNGGASGITFNNGAASGSTLNGSISSGTFSSGSLNLYRFTQVGAIAENLTLTNGSILRVGPNSSFDGDVNFVAPRLYLNGATYKGTAYLEKNGATDDSGNGGNIFNGTTTLVDSGSGYLMTANSAPDTFNGALTVTNSGSNWIYLAHNVAGNVFNNNIAVNNTGSGNGILFSNNATGASTFTNGTITTGGAGFSVGELRLRRFTQVGAISQNLALTGSAQLWIGPASAFDGNVNFVAPRLLLNGATYNGTAYLEKNGATNNDGDGGNIFNQATTIVNSGSGNLLTANNSPDIFNANLTVTNTGSNIIYLAHNVAGNQFNGNITFNSTLGSAGIYFANTVTGSATLGTGASLLTGGLGFSSGELRFKRFTQIGAAAQTLVLTGTSLMRIGPASTFNGNVDFRAPQFALDGAIYNGTTYLEKTGATNNDSNGGNTFNGSTTIANSGAGWFRFALTGLDTFNGDLTLSNTGSSTIRMADNTPGTVFNGNIIVNSTFGGGIYFSESGGGTATLASGRTISVGGLGFSIGELRLRRFTQNGGTPQNLVFTGTAGIVLGPSIIFNGAVDFRAPQVFINSGSYNSTAFIEKTGATDNSGTGSSTFNAAATIRNSGTGFLRTDGNMTFNGATSLINSGSNYLLLELVSGSNYNGDLTLINSGSSNVRMSYQGASNYNGNIEVNSTSGTGIIFSESGTATSTLANGKTISVGSTGFTAGTLTLQRFTQTGGTAQNLVLTGASTFRTGPSATWNGSLIVSSPALFLDGSILNGATNSLIKTGASTDNSVGGNNFVGNTTFTNSGTGIFRLANTTTDDFVGNATFNQASGTIQPAYNIASTFRGNVTVDGASPITFGANNGTITFTGSNAQNVNKSGTASPVFRRLLMNKASNTVTLTTDASVTTNATFTAGVLNTTTTNILTFTNGSTSTGGSNASHIDGPVVKVGNAAFSFPTGDTGIFRPISISAPSTNTHAFRAEYFKAAQAFGGPATYAAGIATVSSCEYWILDRTVGASNVNVTLSWNAPDCTGSYISNLPNLRVVRFDGTNWVSHGNGGTTGNVTTGTLITSAPITSFSPITLGSTTPDNPLPIQLISFTAQVLNETVKLNWITASELNNDFFTIQRSVDGVEFESLAEMDGAGTKQSATEYDFIDTTPKSNISYYRLRQTDFDKTSTYSKVIAVNVSLFSELSMYPNPVSIGTPLNLSRKGDYIILNNLGVTVLKVSGVNQIDISTLMPGVYTLRSSAGDTKRLVIQ